MSTIKVQLKIIGKSKKLQVVARTHNPDFLKSLARSEAQFSKGQVYKFRKLKDLI